MYGIMIMWVYSFVMMVCFTFVIDKKVNLNVFILSELPQLSLTA